MALLGRRTFRDADGMRVAGVWRPVFTRAGEVYFLRDLIIYADGVIDCGTTGLTDLDGLREELRCGRVVTELEEGAQVHVHHVGDWRFAEPRAAVDAEMLIGEVVDEIDRLNGRPDSVERCQIALATYLDDPSEDNRLLLLDHYAAVPPHLSQYVVDSQDLLWTLMTRPGEPELGMPSSSLVTKELHAQALEELREQFRAPRRPSAELAARQQTGDHERAYAPPLIVQRQAYPDGWPDPRGIEVLRNDYPATLTMRGQDYPTVTHAYCALSTIDRDAHDRIVAEPCDLDAVSLAAQAPRQPGWPAARLVVMANLLRVKFLQHPELAQVLLATGDARIIYNSDESGYLTGGPHGANWPGRLLELVRSELAAVEAGFLTVRLDA